MSSSLFVTGSSVAVVEDSYNMTLPYVLQEAYPGIFSSIFPLTVTILLLCLSVLLAIGHKAYRLPLSFCKREERNAAKIRLFCVHMIIFCLVLVLENASHIVAYALSYKGHTTGDESYRVSAFIFYYLYTTTFMISLGQFMVLISQVFHIWLTVIQSLVQNIFTEYVLTLVYIFVIVLDAIGFLACVIGSILFTFPERLISQHRKEIMLVILLAVYAFIMVMLTISILCAGVYIAIQLYKSVRVFRSKGRFLLVVRISIFLVVFVIAVILQFVSLIIRDHIPVYVKAIILDTLPHVLIIVFMSIAFWPTACMCNLASNRLSLRKSTRTQRELMDRFLENDDLSSKGNTATSTSDTGDQL